MIPSILKRAHRAIIHGKATGDPVELLMRCLKSPWNCGTWEGFGLSPHNAGGSWVSSACWRSLGTFGLAVLSQSGSLYYTPLETPVTVTTHCSWCLTQRCFHRGFQKYSLDSQTASVQVGFPMCWDCFKMTLRCFVFTSSNRCIKGKSDCGPFLRCY